MGFTTTAFIRRNTPELRKKLEKLGYYMHPECIDDDRGNYLFVNKGYYLNIPLGYLEELSRSIDCGTNENLFLAIAALRDDTSANQYWVFDQDFPPHYQKGDFTIGHFHRCSCYCHNATVEELIEHFKEKEENHG
ncbi:hypothetical protein AAAU27_13215 [Bacteroides ovatus]|jgi:hypothetical protein|uniref:hypothetical protein n=1 Tax=Bacteroides ovatus TaxID=28116 RepID=UPI0032BFD14F